MKYTAKIGEREFLLETTEGRVRLDGQEVEVSFIPVGASAYSMLVDGRSFRVTVEKVDHPILRVVLNGIEHEVRLWDEHDLLVERLGQTAKAAEGMQHVRAPMPGLVRAVRVAEGDEVQVGSGLVVLEAMKMENELQAEVPGVVRTVLVASGDAVEKNQLLLEIHSGSA